MRSLVYSLLYSAIILMSVTFSGCYYDNEEELYQYVNSQQCDTTNVTFSGTVLPIMNSQCNNCHSSSMASGGIILDTYNGVKAAAVSGHLWGSLAWTAGYSPMPKGGTQLNACELKKIRTWIVAGTPDN